MPKSTLAEGPYVIYSVTEMNSPAKTKILFLVAHPHLQKSRANRAVVEAVSALDDVLVHRLYDHYPYFHIDVAREQKLLDEHELVVIQHPFYWYNMPPLLKLWLDDVWESGWAYGPGGDKLKGKKFLLSLTVGGPKESYCADGYNKFSTDMLLAPWKQTVGLCQMEWCDPLIIHGAIAAAPDVLRNHGALVREVYVLIAREASCYERFNLSS